MDVIKLYLDDDTSSIVEDILVGTKEYWKNLYSNVLKELKEIIDSDIGIPLYKGILAHNNDEYMNRVFPNAKFVIDIAIRNLDKIITNDHLITVDFDDGHLRNMIFYEPITPRLLINRMIDIGIDKENDNHCFLELFHRRDDEIIEAFFGS
jgi:hypothetical protein